MTDAQHRIRIPRDKEHDYTDEMAHKRQAFVSEFTGAGMEHVSKYSFDPSVLPGNIENFVGVAQVPLGIAGPLTIRGEHAQGDFLVPLATSASSPRRRSRARCSLADDRRRHPGALFEYRQIGMVGAFMAGAAYNGAHPDRERGAKQGHQ